MWETKLIADGYTFFMEILHLGAPGVHCRNRILDADNQLHVYLAATFWKASRQNYMYYQCPCLVKVHTCQAKYWLMFLLEYSYLNYILPLINRFRPTIGTPTKDVHWSGTTNTLFQTTFMTNPVIGDQVKCLHSRLEHLIVQSYIVVNSMYAYDTEICVSGIKVT